MLDRIRTLLADAGDKEAFFKRIAFFMPTMDLRYKTIEKAYDAAEKAFENKKRDGGEPASEHWRAVALILIVYLRVKNYHIIVAAILHDIIEDDPANWNLERIAREFGDEVAKLVEWLTKPAREFPDREEMKKAYHKRFAFAPREFFLIKLSDRLHNLITLWSCDEEKRLRKIEETKQYYLPFAEEHLILLYEIEEAIEELEKEKMK
jgi:(p)ppGpp synthase/HD superfamily hydrolase